MRDKGKYVPWARATRRCAFLTCVNAAVALNVLLLLAAASSSEKWRRQPSLRSQAVSVFTIASEIPPAPQTRSPAQRHTESVVPVQASEPRRALRQATWVAEALSASVQSAAHFFAYDDVETPARPYTDWNLEASVLDELGIERLVFDVYINDAGEVIGCTVMEPDSLTSEAKDAIAARLRATSLTPAVRGGRAVASFRTIDLFIAAGP